MLYSIATCIPLRQGLDLNMNFGTKVVYHETMFVHRSWTRPSPCRIHHSNHFWRDVLFYYIAFHQIFPLWNTQRFAYFSSSPHIDDNDDVDDAWSIEGTFPCKWNCQPNDGLTFTIIPKARFYGLERRRVS